MLIPITYREIHIPAMFISIVLGYQLASYFLYLYFKNRDENLGLNRLLLAFSGFFAFLVTAFLFRTLEEHYIGGTLLNEIVNKSMIIFVILSVWSFLLITYTSEFHKIVSSKISKLILISNIIPLVVLVILDTSHYIVQLSMIPNTLGLFYMLFLQLKLLNRSTGNIKRRLGVILLGEVIFGIALVLGGKGVPILLYSPEIQWLFAIILAIFAELIIFIAIYKFPAFLEFEWRENLIKLFILDQKRLSILYSYNFIKNDEIVNNSDEFFNRDRLLTKGIIGIDDIIGSIRGIKTHKLEVIQHGNFLLLLRSGDIEYKSLTFALLIKKEMNSMRYFLTQIKKQFQGFYRDIFAEYELLNGEQVEMFGSFDLILKDLLK